MKDLPFVIKKKYASRTLYTSAEEDWDTWKVTKDRLYNYAEKIGATLINLPKPTRWKNPQWVFLDALDDSLRRGSEDDVFGWIDSDIIITKDAPDILDYDDKFFVTRHPGWHTVYNKNCEYDIDRPLSWKKIHKEYGVPNIYPYPVTAMAKWTPSKIINIVNFVKDYYEYLPKGAGDQEMIAIAAYHTTTPFYYFAEELHGVPQQYNYKSNKFFHAWGGNKSNKGHPSAYKTKLENLIYFDNLVTSMETRDIDLSELELEMAKQYVEDLNEKRNSI